MPELGDVLSWLKYRRLIKKRKVAAKVLSDLHALTVTIHGRQMLTAVCKDGENGLSSEIRRMYWILLTNAPIAEWSEWN